MPKCSLLLLSVFLFVAASVLALGQSPECSQTYTRFDNRGVAYSIPNHSFEDGPSAFLMEGVPASVVTGKGYYGNNSLRLTAGQKAVWDAPYDEAAMGQRKTLSTGVWVYIDGDKGKAGIALECLVGDQYTEVSRADTNVTRRWFYLKTPFMSDKDAGKTVSRVRIKLSAEAESVYFDFVQLGDWQRFNGNHEKMAIMAYQPWYGDKNFPDRWDGWARDSTRAGGEKYDPNVILNPGTPEAKRHIASVYYPLIGAYRSNDREVLEYHTQIIKAMGFDVIQVNYYADRTPYQKEVLEILFDLALRYDMKISILYEPKIHYNDRTPPDQRIIAVGKDMINFINKYKDHKALLQYNGRPLIGSFDYNNVTDSEWGTIIERVKSETGYTMTISSQTINLRSNPEETGTSMNNIESAFKWSLWYEKLRNWDEPGVRDYTERLQALVVDWNKANHFSKLPMGMVYPGFDDTPIRAWAQTPPGIIRKIAGTGPQFYNVSWDSFLKHREHLDWVNIATFNDWNEGTILEPSRELGHELAFITAQRMAEWKGTPAPTLEQIETITTRYLKTRTVNYD